jgi:hypothetical protein
MFSSLSPFRILTLVGPAAVVLSTAACAHTTPPAVSTSSAAPRAPDPPPVAVTYRIVRSVDGDGVLLSGRMDISVHDDGRVESASSRTGASEQLQLTVRPEDDGTLIARARYEERSQEGATIKWAPAMRVARGTPARAEVTGAGWARAIEVTVQ